MPDGLEQPRHAVRKIEHWHASYRPGGWVRLDSRGQAPSGFRGKVFLRLQPSDEVGGRLLVHQAVMAGNTPISARTWRQVPFAEVEAYAMNRDVLNVLSLPTEIVADVVVELSRYFDETERKYGHVECIPATPSSCQPIQPPRGRITDDFLRHLATAYARATTEGRAPGPAIAEEAGVSVRTVHGWISQARKRGILAPARRGRAC